MSKFYDLEKTAVFTLLYETLFFFAFLFTKV